MGYVLSGVEGYVTDKITAQAIANAHITTNTGTSVYSDIYGYYYFPHPAGPINMYCATSGYRNWSKLNINLSCGVTKLINIKMAPCL